MQPSHQFGGLDVRGILVTESPTLHPQDEAERLYALGQGIEILASLHVGRLKVTPGALLLYEQDARPVQVDEAMSVIQLLDVRLIARGGAPLNSEQLEEVIVETLRLAFLVRSVLPFFSEGGRARSNLVPGETRGLQHPPAETIIHQAFALTIAA